MVDVSIIIVSYNSTGEIIPNIKSIKEHITSLKYEILVINNFVGDSGIKAALSAYDNVTVMEAGSNLGFGRANNLGLKQAKGRYILFVNPDVIFLSDIKQLTDILENDPEIGLIGPATYNGKGDVLPSCGEYPGIKNLLSDSLLLNSLFPGIKWWGNLSMRYFDFKGAREVDWISGAFMLGRKSTLDRIGGFDKDFFMYCEDIDICWRLKKLGYKIVFNEKAGIIHNAGHSVESKSTAKARMITESSRILWSKYYKRGTVKKMFFILCLGSVLRKICWKILNLIHVSKKKNMSAYYQTIITEAINYLRSDGN